MTPYCTYLLTAKRLPYILAIFYILPCKQYCTIWLYDFYRNRWRLAIDLPAEVKQN